MAKNTTEKGYYTIKKSSTGSLSAYFDDYYVCGFSHISVRTIKKALSYMQTVEDEFGKPDLNNTEQLRRIKNRLRQLGPMGEISFN